MPFIRMHKKLYRNTNFNTNLLTEIQTQINEVETADVINRNSVKLHHKNMKF